MAYRNQLTSAEIEEAQKSYAAPSMMMKPGMSGERLSPATATTRAMDEAWWDRAMYNTTFAGSAGGAGSASPIRALGTLSKPTLTEQTPKSPETTDTQTTPAGQNVAATTLASGGGLTGAATAATNLTAGIGKAAPAVSSELLSGYKSYATKAMKFLLSSDQPEYANTYVKTSGLNRMMSYDELAQQDERVSKYVSPYEQTGGQATATAPTATEAPVTTATKKTGSTLVAPSNLALTDKDAAAAGYSPTPIVAPTTTSVYGFSK